MRDEIEQSTNTATHTVQIGNSSNVQDTSTNTHAVTVQQNVQHTDQANVQSTQISERTVSGQETQPAPTIKRRPSPYQIPSTVSIQKLKSKT